MVQTFEIPLPLILHHMFKFLLSYYELHPMSLFITKTHFAYTLATRGIPYHVLILHTTFECKTMASSLRAI